MFITAIGFVGLNVYNTINAMILLKCVSMSNQECMVRQSNYPYCVAVNKCSGSCNDINNPYSKFCVPGFVKYINI